MTRFGALKLGPLAVSQRRVKAVEGLAETSIHIGASGLVFGWFGFFVVRGLVDRSLITPGAALVVGVLYGSILWGVLPGQPGVSWEAHLFGAIAGATAAFLVRTHVHAPSLGDVDRD